MSVLDKDPSVLKLLVLRINSKVDKAFGCSIIILSNKSTTTAANTFTTEKFYLVWDLTSSKKH